MASFRTPPGVGVEFLDLGPGNQGGIGPDYRFVEADGLQSVADSIGLPAYMGPYSDVWGCMDGRGLAEINRQVLPSTRAMARMPGSLPGTNTSADLMDPTK